MNYTSDTLKHLAAVEFTYDSSSSASIPVTDPGTDAYWPYTLDYGMANDCLSVLASAREGPSCPAFGRTLCMLSSTSVALQGSTLWTLGCGYCQFSRPPLLTFSSSDPANGASEVNDTATLEYMQNTFTAHYTGNRQPIGLYTHPIHTAVWSSDS